MRIQPDRRYVRRDGKVVRVSTTWDGKLVGVFEKDGSKIATFYDQQGIPTSPELRGQKFADLVDEMIAEYMVTWSVVDARATEES